MLRTHQTLEVEGRLESKLLGDIGDYVFDSVSISLIRLTAGFSGDISLCLCCMQHAVYCLSELEYVKSILSLEFDAAICAPCCIVLGHDSEMPAAQIHVPKGAVFFGHDSGMPAAQKAW